MPERVYNGPCPEVELVLPDGSTVNAVHGEPVDVPSELAKSLDEQGDTWLTKGKASKVSSHAKASADIEASSAPVEGEKETQS